LFESLDRPDTAARFRGIAAVPVAAVVATQILLTLAPLFGGFPSWFMKAIEVALFVTAGDALFRTAALAIQRRSELDTPAVLWLIAAVAAALFAAWNFFTLTFPGRSFF
jgi:hypothetical protein